MNRHSNKSHATEEVRFDFLLKQLELVLSLLANEQYLRSALPKSLPPDPWKVFLTLLPKKVQIKKLNQKHRAKNKPTDVLSFPCLEPFWSQGFLGDLVISIPVALEQSLFYKHALADELLILMVHGVLHLLGMDHEQGPKESVQMALLEKKVLKFMPQAQHQNGLIGRTDEKKIRYSGH